MSKTVLVKREPDAVTLVLNRPESRNALSRELLAALRDALASSAGLAVTITGAGDCFSAGADVTQLKGTGEDIWIDEAIAEVNELIRASAAGVTALVNGPCIGGAVDLALNCRDRIATANAWFQVPATRLSLLYSPTAVEYLVNRYGAGLVSRLLADGEHIGAQAALELGLVSSVSGPAGPAIAARPGDPGCSRASEANRQMIKAIEQGRYDPDHWQRVRMEFLASPERRAAIRRMLTAITG